MKTFKNIIYSKWIWLIVLLIPLISGNLAFAQTTNDNFIDPILSQYASNSSAWEAPLRGFATKVFWLLVLIDFVWGGIELLMNKGDLGDWMLNLAKQLIVIGFFFALITYSSDWASAIIQSFRLAGDAANSIGGSGLGPTDIFDTGINIVTTILKSMRLDRLTDSIALAFGAVIMLISFALIAALQVVVLVESYIFTYAGIIFLGFGGSRFTRTVAQRFLFGIVAVGAKLFVIHLIIGLAVVMVHQWDAQVDASQGFIDLGMVMRIAGGSVVFLALAKMIPEMVQGMLNGASYSSGAAMLQSSMAGMHVGMGMLNAAGATATGGLSAGAGLMGFKGAASSLGNASSNMANAAGNHASDAFSQGMGMTPGSFNQYMPGPATSAPPGNFSMRQEKNSVNLKDKELTGNAIGGDN